MAPKYAVVEFLDEGNCVAVVPHIWLDENSENCRWPHTLPQTKIMKAVHQCVPVPANEDGSWISCPVNVLCSEGIAFILKSIFFKLALNSYSIDEFDLLWIVYISTQALKISKSEIAKYMLIAYLCYQCCSFFLPTAFVAFF